MKKIFVLCMTAVMVLSMAACGEKDATANASGSAATTETSEAQVASSSVALKDLNVDTYVTLGDYKNLNVEITEPSEDDVDYYVSYYYQMLVEPDQGIKDRAVENGDTINLDYSGRKVDEEEPFDGGTAQDQYLEIGSGTFIDGFEDQLIGVMPGETVDLAMSFPEEYHSADLAGEPVIFTCTVNYILPALTDELVSGFGLDVSTVAEFRQYMKDMIKSYAQEDTDTLIVDALLEQTTFNMIPESMISERKEDIRRSLETAAQDYEMTAEDLVSTYYGMELEDFLTQQAEEMLKVYMVCQAIANREDLNVTDDVLEDNLSYYASYVGYEDVETFLKEYNGGATRENYREQIMYTNVMEYLTETIQ